MDAQRGVALIGVEAVDRIEELPAFCRTEFAPAERSRRVRVIASERYASPPLNVRRSGFGVGGQLLKLAAAGAIDPSLAPILARTLDEGLVLGRVDPGIVARHRNRGQDELAIRNLDRELSPVIDAARFRCMNAARSWRIGTFAPLS